MPKRKKKQSKHNPRKQEQALTKAKDESQEELLPPDSVDMSVLAGAGMEDVTIQDLLIPRIAILQALSPQVQENEPEYVEGAKPGMICDVSIGELIESPLTFIPCHFSKVWIEWYPRQTQKGIATIHNTPDIKDECEVEEDGNLVLENGNLIMETAQLFGLNMNNNGSLCFIPMASTQLKAARKLITFAMGERLTSNTGNEYTPPLFYRAYILDVMTQRNSKGTWYGWDISRGPPITSHKSYESLIQKCVDVQRDVIKGRSRGDYNAGQKDTEQESEAI